MRVVLIPTVMLFCAAPIFAQGTQAEVQPDSPATMMSRRPMRSQQALLPREPSRTARTGVDVPPETPVVTLDGVCEQSHGPATKACKTVITRAQIDSLMDLLTPEATPAERRSFAVSYARLLAASTAAERQHVEKDPAVAAELEAQLKLTRLRVLSNSFYRQMGERSADVPESEIQKYYADHKAHFDAGLVRRLSIPKSVVTRPAQPLDASGVRASLDDLVARASKGEDFDQLEREAYTTLGIATPPPPTIASLVRRSSLRPDEAKVFDLNVGEVTPMLTSPDAFEILKLESKEPIPLEIAQSEIKPLLVQARKAEELTSAANDVTADFNLAYLGLFSAPELFVPPAPAQPPAARGPEPGLRSRVLTHRRMPLGAMVPRAFPPSPR